MLDECGAQTGDTNRPEGAGTMQPDTILQACAQAEVPVPPIGLGVAEGIAMDRVGSDGTRME